MTRRTCVSDSTPLIAWIPAVRPLVARLRAADYRITDRIVEELLDRLGE